MEEQTEEKVDITQLSGEERRLIEKIRKIGKSNELKEFIRRIESYAENLGISETHSRLKTEKSALDKFRSKGYTDADRLHDLVGLMFVTDNEEQIYEVAEYMKECLPAEAEITETEDMVRNPKNGYRSYHVNAEKNDFSDMDGIRVPIEIQIKTRPMLIAQDTVHDTLYKRDTMDAEIRKSLSSVFFPIIERLAQINGFIENSTPEKQEQLRQEIKQIKFENKEILQEYTELLKEVAQQYKHVVKKQKEDSKNKKQNFLDGVSDSLDATEYDNELSKATFSKKEFKELAESRKKEDISIAIKETIHGVKSEIEKDYTKEDLGEEK